MKSYREWRSLNEMGMGPGELNIARTQSQGRQGLKGMHPAMTPLANNIAMALSEIENNKPGFAKMIMTRLISGLRAHTDIEAPAINHLKRVLTQEIMKLPTAPAQTI